MWVSTERSYRLVQTPFKPAKKQMELQCNKTACELGCSPINSFFCHTYFSHFAQFTRFVTYLRRYFDHNLPRRPVERHPFISPGTLLGVMTRDSSTTTAFLSQTWRILDATFNDALPDISPFIVEPVAQLVSF